MKSAVNAEQAAKEEFKTLKVTHHEVTMEKAKHYAASLSINNALAKAEEKITKVPGYVF
jgi:hypothetical protein